MGPSLMKKKDLQRSCSRGEKKQRISGERGRGQVAERGEQGGRGADGCSCTGLSPLP